MSIARTERPRMLSGLVMRRMGRPPHSIRSSIADEEFMARMMLSPFSEKKISRASRDCRSLLMVV